MSKIKSAGLVTLVAGFISLGWGLREIARNAVPYFANSMANRYTSAVEGNYSQNTEKAETEGPHNLRLYLMTGSAGIAGIAAGLWMHKREDYEPDFGVTGVIKSSRRHNKVVYMDAPKIKPDELDNNGRFKI